LLNKIGIDEAGRGAIIGPLIIGIVETDKELNVDKDSKELTPNQREKLFDYISKNSLTSYIEISVQEIEKYNINEIEYKKILHFIQDKSAIIYIDAFTHPSKFAKFKNIIAEYKADKKYSIVKAASIIAKVIRDRRIEEIKQQTGIDFGSGYSSDPRTLNAIREHYKILQPYIRHKWITLTKLWKL
jgi:ribonuclease HII